MRTIRFQISYFTKPGENIIVSGNASSLGNWALGAALKLTYADGLWHGQVELESTTKLEYKYALVSHDTLWEAGKNRVVDLQTLPAGNVLLFDAWKVCLTHAAVTRRPKKALNLATCTRLFSKTFSTTPLSL